MTFYQCLNSRTPPYLPEHCIPVSSADTRWHLRSANRHLYLLYYVSDSTLMTVCAWSSLLDFIRDPTSSTDCFRHLIKTYLFARY